MNDNNIEMYAIWIVGGDSAPYALFRTEEMAIDWARDNYFGQWLMKKVEIPYIPICTEVELEKARREAEKLAAFFKELPEADD